MIRWFKLCIKNFFINHIFSYIYIYSYKNFFRTKNWTIVFNKNSNKPKKAIGKGDKNYFDINSYAKVFTIQKLAICALNFLYLKLLRIY